MKILNDETDYFLYEKRIDILHYTIPKLSNQLLQEKYFYKAFQVGTLYHVYSEDYGAGIQITNSAINCMFKNKAPDSKVTLMDEERVFPFLKMGDKISTCQENRVFYLNSKDTINDDYFDISK